jgi:hypothetical protein
LINYKRENNKLLKKKNKNYKIRHKKLIKLKKLKYKFKNYKNKFIKINKRLNK